MQLRSEAILSGLVISSGELSGTMVIAIGYKHQRQAAVTFKQILCIVLDTGHTGVRVWLQILYAYIFPTVAKCNVQVFSYGSSGLLYGDFTSVEFMHCTKIMFM